MIIRTTEKGCRQRWRPRVPYSSRKITDSSNKAKNFERKLIKSVCNRLSYKH